MVEILKWTMIIISLAKTIIRWCILSLKRQILFAFKIYENDGVALWSIPTILDRHNTYGIYCSKRGLKYEKGGLMFTKVDFSCV